MKDRFTVLIVGIVIAMAIGQTAFAVDAGIFVAEIDRAADDAVSAWIRNDPKTLEKALQRLALNEAYLLAIGRSAVKQSYLSQVPGSISSNMGAMAAYLFLIRKEREGILLRPAGQFEGRRFQFVQKGGR